MELRQLRYFVAIVDHGSLSRAALVLHVAQPALTPTAASSSR
jgi:LysR family nitrogen assimilation transcriptional regulator